MQHALITALAQAGILVAEIVVNQGNALPAGVSQTADHVL